MGVIGGALGYHLLRRIAPSGDGFTVLDGAVYNNKSKLEILLGTSAVDAMRGLFVVDFGCGVGDEAIDLARRGASKVVGVDIQDEALTIAREKALRAGLADRVTFSRSHSEKADAVVSIDAFEHFEDPALILRLVADLMSTTGRFYISFGPTWYHPLGGHLFSVFPWAHLLFTERALIRWRTDFKTDGATRFGEVAGGLNQMTIRRFRKLVEDSPLCFERFELVPIRRLNGLHNRITQEFTTAIVRATLRHRV